MTTVSAVDARGALFVQRFHLGLFLSASVLNATRQLPNLVRYCYFGVILESRVSAQDARMSSILQLRLPLDIFMATISLPDARNLQALFKVLSLLHSQ